jgi:uncharacterized protein
MLLDLTRVPREGEDIVRTYEPAAFAGAGDEDYVVAAPVVLDFRITRDKDRYRLRGRVGTTLQLGCGRCLEPFLRPVDSAFELDYVPQGANTGEGEIEIEADDLSTAYYRDETIDLGHLMREQFYLALPMKPLCSPDCRGLCPVCGTNLNKGTCACEQRWEDPRLAPLKRLVEDPADRH